MLGTAEVDYSVVVELFIGHVVVCVFRLCAYMEMQGRVITLLHAQDRISFRSGVNSAISAELGSKFSLHDSRWR